MRTKTGIILEGISDGFSIFSVVIDSLSDPLSKDICQYIKGPESPGEFHFKKFSQVHDKRYREVNIQEPEKTEFFLVPSKVSKGYI
jgi:hypothetical protein